MRLSVAPVAISSLVLGTLADFSGRPSPPLPPGSACAEPSDKYRPKSDQAPPVVVETEGRSLGITRLPRQWARDLLGSIVEGAEQVVGARCVSLQCACIHVRRKTSYGVYTRSQCPAAHRASWETCNVQEDGYTVRFPSPLKLNYIPNLCVPDASASSRVNQRAWRGAILRTRTAMRHSRARQLCVSALGSLLDRAASGAVRGE